MSFSSIAARFSQRFAEKRRWMAPSSMSRLDCRYELIIWPMDVVRSGYLHSSASMPAALRVSTRRVDCVVLPQRSTPSKRMKAPRAAMLAAILVVVVVVVGEEVADVCTTRVVALVGLEEKKTKRDEDDVDDAPDDVDRW